MKLLRFSFPQLLLVAFLLIGALLGTAALRALFTLDTLMAQSRESAAQAMTLSHSRASGEMIQRCACEARLKCLKHVHI